ncbi:MAG: phosphoribosylanthranilate isomerase [Gammaproteobacteria bacterium]
MRTRVKICGITRVEDGVFAAQSGVDAIGLVFYTPSPRNVGLNRAVEIVKALPPFVTVVALFVDETERRIRQVLDTVHVGLIQFHGEEPADYCRSFGKPYIKAVGMRDDIDIYDLASEYHDAAGLLLDAYHPMVKGGTGSRFDWDRIPTQCTLPIILAGGLNVENAREAVRRVKPYALDVSSGVEAGKGIKDAEKITVFMKEVYEGDRSK